MLVFEDYNDGIGSMWEKNKNSREWIENKVLRSVEFIQTLAYLTCLPISGGVITKHSICDLLRNSSFSLGWRCRKSNHKRKDRDYKNIYRTIKEEVKDHVDVEYERWSIYI